MDLLRRVFPILLFFDFTKAFESCENLNFFSEETVQAADDIFIVDTSVSINSLEFSNAVDFIRTLVEKRFVLRPDLNRFAVVTFSLEAQVVFDFISKGAPVMPECELFHPSGLWESQFTYSRDVMTEDSILAALTLVRQIATNSVSWRNNATVTKRLWILTDSHDITNFPTYDVIQSMLPGYTVYGGGLNVCGSRSINRQVVRERFCNLTVGVDHSDCDCFYKHVQQRSDSFSGCDRTTWNQLLHNTTLTRKLRIKEDVANSDLVDSVNLTVDGYSSCKCREFQHDGYFICAKDSHIEDSSSTVYIVVIVILAATIIILFAAFLLFVFMYKRHLQKGIRKTKPQLAPSVSDLTTVTTISSNKTLPSNGTLQSSRTHHNNPPSTTGDHEDDDKKLRSKKYNRNVSYLTPVRPQQTLPVIYDLQNSSDVNLQDGIPGYKNIRYDEINGRLVARALCEDENEMNTGTLQRNPTYVEIMPNSPGDRSHHYSYPYVQSKEIKSQYLTPNSSELQTQISQVYENPETFSSCNAATNSNTGSGKSSQEVECGETTSYYDLPLIVQDKKVKTERVVGTVRIGRQKFVEIASVFSGRLEKDNDVGVHSSKQELNKSEQETRGNRQNLQGDNSERNQRKEPTSPSSNMNQLL